jgi:hypothetical protein
VIGDDVIGANAKDNHIVAELDAPVAHIVEQGFVGMGKAHQRRKSERSGTTLDGVDGTEHRIEPVGVALTRLDGGKLLLKLGQKLGTLVEIGGFEVVQIAHGRLIQPFWVWS